MKKTREEQEIRELDDLFERYRQAPDSFVFVPLADACRKMGRIDEALEICELGVERHPDYPSGHVVRGKCLFDRGDRQGARDTFERVLILDENNLVALKYLGTIEADAGDLSAARRHFRQILSLDPENKEIKTILNAVDEQARPGSEPEAPVADVMEGVDEILRGSADEVETDSDPGIMADLVEAEAPEVEDVARVPCADEIETSDELASVTLAEIFASQGYKAKAEKIYREVLRRQPGSGEARRRLRALTSDETGEGAAGRDVEPADTTPIAGAGPGAIETPAPGIPVGPGPGIEEGVGPSTQPGGPVSEAETLSESPPVEAGAALGAARAEISERDSLGHFRRWLTRLQK